MHSTRSVQRQEVDPEGRSNSRDPDCCEVVHGRGIALAYNTDVATRVAGGLRKPKEGYLRATLAMSQPLQRDGVAGEACSALGDLSGHSLRGVRGARRVDMN